MFSNKALKYRVGYDTISLIENCSQKLGGIMSTETLSYFLKNSDQRLRLGFQIVLQCAPFLKGLKVSCVISVDAELYGRLSELFTDMDISYRRLSCTDGRCLVLFYRPEELEKYLMEPGVCELIQKYGYTDMQVERVLAHLSDRIRGFNRKGMGFPHEIGVFLGYPLDDVKGFIENAGKKYLMIGYWKVYSDLAGARTAFMEYDRAKDCAVNEFLTGKSIREIAL